MTTSNRTKAELENEIRNLVKSYFEFDYAQTDHNGYESNGTTTEERRESIPDLFAPLRIIGGLKVDARKLIQIIECEEATRGFNTISTIIVTGEETEEQKENRRRGLEHWEREKAAACSEPAFE